MRVWVILPDEHELLRPAEMPAGTGDRAVEKKS